MKEIFKQIHRYKEQDFEEGRQFEFTLNRKENNDNKRLEPYKNVSNDKMEVGKSYKITVKKYMTEPATVNFDFQNKWNNGNPMPLCIMQGEVIKETRGMYYMNLLRRSSCPRIGKKLRIPAIRRFIEFMIRKPERSVRT